MADIDAIATSCKGPGQFLRSPSSVLACRTLQTCSRGLGAEHCCQQLPAPCLQQPAQSAPGPSSCFQHPPTLQACSRSVCLPVLAQCGSQLLPLPDLQMAPWSVAAPGWLLSAPLVAARLCSRVVPSHCGLIAADVGACNPAHWCSQLLPQESAAGSLVSGLVPPILQQLHGPVLAGWLSSSLSCCTPSGASLAISAGSKMLSEVLDQQHASGTGSVRPAHAFLQAADDTSCMPQRLQSHLEGRQCTASLSLPVECTG